MDSVAVGESRQWAFSGTQGERIIVSAVRTSGTLNTQIRLYRGGQQEAAPSFGGDRLDHQLLTSGMYTVFIEDDNLLDVGTYNLTFVKILPDSMRSPGDPDGGPIASGQTTNGQMNLTSDIDGFQFLGNAGERVIVSAVRTSGALNTQIRLYPPIGGAQEAAPSFGGDRLDHQLLTTGIYTVLIEDDDLLDPGVYNLTFVKIPGAVSFVSDLDGGLISLVDLPVPGMSGPSSAVINVPSDVDVFQIYGAAGDSIVVMAVRTSGALNTQIRLYPPAGGAQEAAPSFGADQLIHQLASTGLYTIFVEDDNLNDTGAYAITVSKAPRVLGTGIYAPQPPVGGRVYSEGTWGSLTWQPSISLPDTVLYDVFLGTDVMEPLSLVASGSSINSVHVPTLTPGPVYYWHVVAYAGADTIEGPYWWFHSSNATDAPGQAEVAPVASRALRLLNSPNPFNPQTMLTYSVSKPNFVQLSIHDVRGRLVAALVSRWQASGTYSIPWSGCDASGTKVGSGLYLARLVIGSDVQKHKMVLAK